MSVIYHSMQQSRRELRIVSQRIWFTFVQRRRKSVLPTRGCVYELTTHTLRPDSTDKFLDVSHTHLQRLSNVCELPRFFVTDGPGHNEVVSFSKYENFEHRDLVNKTLGKSKDRNYRSEYENNISSLVINKETFILLRCPWFDLQPLSTNGLYELRMYKLRAGKYAEYVHKLLPGLKIRSRYSRPAGIWLTEIGDLSRMMFLWPYQSLQERINIRGDAIKDEVWRETLRNCSQYVEDLSNKILLPIPLFPKEETQTN